MLKSIFKIENINNDFQCCFVVRRGFIRKVLFPVFCQSLLICFALVSICNVARTVWIMGFEAKSESLIYFMPNSSVYNMRHINGIMIELQSFNNWLLSYKFNRDSFHVPDILYM